VFWHPGGVQLLLLRGIDLRGRRSVGFIVEDPLSQLVARTGTKGPPLVPVSATNRDQWQFLAAIFPSRAKQPLFPVGITNRDQRHISMCLFKQFCFPPYFKSKNNI
jgi:hypothetical protein